MPTIRLKPLPEPTIGLPMVEQEPVQHYPEKTATVVAVADARPKTGDLRQRGIKSAKLSKIGSV